MFFCFFSSQVQNIHFPFSLLDWTPAHSERNIVKVIGHIPQLEAKHELPHDIDYYAFTKFTNVYFKVSLSIKT